MNLNTAHSQVVTAAGICLLASAAWLLLPHPLVPVAVGLAPLAAVFVLTRPFLIVLLFVVFSFFRLHEVFPQLYSLKIPLLLSLGALAALGWHIGFTRRIQPYWHPDLTRVSVFFVLVTIGVVLASNRPIAIEYFKGVYWKIALMTFAIAWLAREARDFALAARLIVISGSLVGIVALSNKASGIGLVEGTRVTIGRAIGSVLGDPNDLALVLMFPMAFALGLLLTRGLPRSTFWLGLIAVPLLFSAVIATQSRGGLLGILTLFAVFGYRRIKSKALLIAIGVVAAGALFLMAGISGRASGGAAEAGVDASAMGRLYAWEAAFGMALHNPLTGVGLDNFYSNYYFYSPHWDGLNHAVHSTWFGVLAESGFLGLAVFISLILGLVRSARSALLRVTSAKSDPVIQATAESLLAGLLATAVSGTFLTQGFTWPIYILTALVVALSRWVQVHLDAR